MSAGLSVSRLIGVQINLTPALAQAPNLQSCLVLGSSNVIDTVTRIRSYDSLVAIGVDFGTTSPEYLAATLWFGQKPQPTTLLIGRWVKIDSGGELFCGPVLVANRVVGPWNAINNGSFNVQIDGVPHAVGGLDFSASGNMNAVAGVIESGIPGGTATCLWDATNFRFVLTSATTGVGSEVDFLTAGLVGTDISAMMAGLATSAGAFEAAGLAAQSILNTVVLFDNRFSSQWYGLGIADSTLSNDNVLAVSAYIEASTNQHFFETTSADPECVNANSTTDIAYLLQQLGVTRTWMQYSSVTEYAGISALARILTTDWQAQNSTITLMYKDEPLVVAENLTADQATALFGLNGVGGKNANAFVNYNNGIAIIQPGITPSGQFADTVIGCDWLQDSVQTNLFNALYGSKKIPQTDGGNHVLATQIEAACTDAVNNGLLASGVWDADGFGQLSQGDFMPKGFYVYAPPIASQSQSDRSARKSVAFQVAAKLAGAVQTVNVLINVNS